MQKVRNNKSFLSQATLAVHLIIANMNYFILNPLFPIHSPTMAKQTDNPIITQNETKCYIVICTLYSLGSCQTSKYVALGKITLLARVQIDTFNFCYIYDPVEYSASIITVHTYIHTCTHLSSIESWRRTEGTSGKWPSAAAKLWEPHSL